jgi:excisionase family DNA binding protein
MSALPASFDDCWRDMFKNLPVVLTAKELEPVLGLNRKTIFHMAHKGILPSYRYGRNVRFNKYEILRWLEAHRDGPPPARDKRL